jgi:hypothetical protein
MISEEKGNDERKLRATEKRSRKCEEKDENGSGKRESWKKRKESRIKLKKASEEKYEDMCEQLKAAKYIGHRLRASM